VALWNQSAVKQTVVAGYARSVEVTRPLFNAIAPLIRAPRLPPIGAALKSVYLSHLAVRSDGAEDFKALMRTALTLARERGFDIAVLGLAALHPLIEVVRRGWKTREYRSLLHVVQWPGRAEYRTDRGAGEPDRICHPEIALM
jgi:hypothetical protein